LKVSQNSEVDRPADPSLALAEVEFGFAGAEIKAGERFIGSYILDPVVQTFDESLREP
jgi:hypothetical protein